MIDDIPGWSSRLESIIEEIAEVASEVLSEWECTFIEDIRGKTSFTPKQTDKIEELYKKVCESPF